MNTGRHQRSIKSMRLTRKYHFRYMGLWIFICLCLLVIMNVLICLLLRETWANMQLRAGLLVDDVSPIGGSYLMAIGVECILFTCAIVFLAKSTAHRIAGPYIRLRHAFGEVAAGNLHYVLRFRAYDRLEEVEAAFNAMMATFRKERAGSDPAQAVKADPAQASPPT